MTVQTKTRSKDGHVDQQMLNYITDFGTLNSIGVDVVDRMMWRILEHYDVCLDTKNVTVNCDFFGFKFIFREVKIAYSMFQNISIGCYTLTTYFVFKDNNTLFRCRTEVTQNKEELIGLFCRLIYDTMYDVYVMLKIDSDFITQLS